MLLIVQMLNYCLPVSGQYRPFAFTSNKYSTCVLAVLLYGADTSTLMLPNCLSHAVSEEDPVSVSQLERLSPLLPSPACEDRTLEPSCKHVDSDCFNMSPDSTAKSQDPTWYWWHWIPTIRCTLLCLRLVQVDGHMATHVWLAGYSCYKHPEVDM